MKTTAFVLVTSLIAVLLGFGSAPREGREALPSNRPADRPVTAFAAASMTDALEEVKAEFAKTAGVAVRTNYAASSALAVQIEHGAEADVFISADTRWARHLEENGLVAKRVNLLGNRLVIVVPADAKFALTRPAELASDAVKHIALSDPEAVPAGRYARQALRRLGLWDELKHKVVAAEDVRHTLAYVETGTAEAAIVYATDAAVSKRVKVAVEIAAELTEPIECPVVLLKQGSACKEAEAFYDYLVSPQAARVFRRHGFAVLTDGGGAR